MQRVPSTYSRRTVLRAASGLAVTGALAAACGGNTGRSGGGGSGPTISQWYHEYGEEGVQQAVQRYAAAYRDATVKVQWTPGGYDSKLAAALLTNDGPDV